MKLETTVRSSGWGPRAIFGVPLVANALWHRRLLGHAMRMVEKRWPKDGVAITIRRAS